VLEAASEGDGWWWASAHHGVGGDLAVHHGGGGVPKSREKNVYREKCIVQQKIDRKIRHHLPYKWLPRSAYFSPKQKSISISRVIGTHFEKPVNNSHKKAQNVPFQHRFVDNMSTTCS
jgi:hypothetical protein